LPLSYIDKVDVKVEFLTDNSSQQQSSLNHLDFVQEAITLRSCSRWLHHLEKKELAIMKMV
jgi:hypothetical protein